MTNRSVMARGTVAGVLAATSIVLFFFVRDLLAGEVLRTPSLLAAGLLGRDEVGAGLLALYTVFHFGAFVLIGVGTAWLIERARIPAVLLLGVVAGVLLFNLVFYTSVWVAGVDITAALGWPALLAGNIIAGLVLIGWLRHTSPREERSIAELLRDHDTVREGVIIGVAGAAVLAVWFLAVDLVMGRAFFTPAALGSALFLGAEGIAAVRFTAPIIAGYTAVHVAAFVLAGLIFAGLAARAEDSASWLMAMILLFVAALTLGTGLITVLATWLLGAIPWWAIAIGNLLAAMTMAALLWKRHPALAGALPRAEETAAEEEGTSAPGARRSPGPSAAGPERRYEPRGASEGSSRGTEAGPGRGR